MELQLGDVWNTWTWWNESWKTIPQSKTCFMNGTWMNKVCEHRSHTCSLLFMTTGILVSNHFFVIPRYKMITNYNQFTWTFTFKSTDLFLEPPQPPSVSEKSPPSPVEHGVEDRHRVFEQTLRPLDFQHDVLIARLPWRFFTPHPTHTSVAGGMYLWWDVWCKVTHGFVW